MCPEEETSKGRKKVSKIQQKQKRIGARPTNIDTESDLSIQIENKEPTRPITDMMLVEKR